MVITDSHPMDSDLRQGVKALANTPWPCARRGDDYPGQADEGVGVFGLADEAAAGPGGLRLLAPLLLPLVPSLSSKGWVRKTLFLYFALQAMRQATLLMYGPASRR